MSHFALQPSMSQIFLAYKDNSDQVLQMQDQKTTTESAWYV